MDIELLNTFLEVSKTRHFGKAADNLFLTQSAVSARVRALESALDAQLFERTTKQVVLTAEGEKLLKHAETILLAWTNAKLDVSSSVDSDQLLSLGATSGLWHFVFNQKLVELQDRADVFVNALSYSSEELARLLCSNAIDLVLLYEKIQEPAIESIALGSLNLRLFSTEKVTTKTQLKALKYVHVDWGSSFSHFFEKHFKGRIVPVMQTDNAQTAHYLIEQAGGAAYLPDLIDAESQGLYRVDKKFAPIYKRKLYGCYNNNNIKKKMIIDKLGQLTIE